MYRLRYIRIVYVYTDEWKMIWLVYCWKIDNDVDEDDDDDDFVF